MILQKKKKKKTAIWLKPNSEAEYISRNQKSSQEKKLQQARFKAIKRAIAKAYDFQIIKANQSRKIIAEDMQHNVENI